MSINEFIKEKTEEMVEKYKAGFLKGGSPITERDETFFRNGIANGLMIAGLSLVNADYNDILEVNKDQ
jgi:triosephosphate isomerase